MSSSYGTCEMSHTISLKPACSAGPRALPIVLFSANMSPSLPNRASNDARASDRLTRRSVGFGRKTSSMSDTTNIDESVVPAYIYSVDNWSITSLEKARTGIEKKYSDTSNAMMATFVRFSSFGMRSRFSRIVRVAVATMPLWMAA